MGLATKFPDFSLISLTNLAKSLKLSLPPYIYCYLEKIGGFIRLLTNLIADIAIPADRRMHEKEREKS